VRHKIQILAVLVSLALPLAALAQGTFQNLDFESPIPPLTPDPIIGVVPITNALPGWTGYLNGNPTDWVFYPNVALAGPSISMVNSLSPIVSSIQGNYSVFLNNAAIGQTGQIPSGASSLLFLRVSQSGFQVSFGGQSIPLVQFGTSGNNIIMAANISMFAGQTGELLFAGGGLFDDIRFSNQPIPEPSASCLLGLGALLVGWHSCRSKSGR